MLQPREVDVERVEWAAFLAGFTWRQGEHVALIGPTGSGKTTLARAILPCRDFVVATGTKRTDPSLDALRRHDGYQLAKSWPPPPARADQLGRGGAPREWRVLLWPPIRSSADVFTQRRVFGAALESIFQSGGWCVYIDELRYFLWPLGLQSILELLWTQARSNNVSIVGGTQRPANVPLLLYDQSRHLFFWQDNDEANLKRIGGIGGLSSKLIRETVAGLAEHDVLYVNSRTRQLLITRVRR